MRKISKPAILPQDVFDACVDSIHDGNLQSKFKKIANNFAAAAADYDNLATGANLYQIAAYVGNNTSVVIGGVTKDELKKLYSQQMVGENKPARKIYETLRALSLGMLCPLCGFGQVKTLDHYLPKGKFPLYSVMPSNLVPACRDCNTGKLTKTGASAEEQTIHPYFDKKHYFEDQWLFAEVKQTSPATVIFFSDPPKSWDLVSMLRVKTHIKNYDLSSRFRIQVADHLSSLRYELNYLSDAKSRSEHLLQRATSSKQVHVNSWQTALHQALYKNAWYCQSGFTLS